MTELLSHWMPQPEHAPAGFTGVLLVVACLAGATYASQMAAWAMFGTGLVFAAGVALCIISIARERSRLFGFLGISAAVLYGFCVLTTSVLALMA